MKRSNLVTMFLAGLMLASTGAMLQAAMKDSADFPYQQNGTLDPNPYLTPVGMTDAGGGILNFDGGDGITATPTWAAQSANITANGFTVEMRIKVTASGAFTHSFGIMTSNTPKLGWFGVKTNELFTQYGPGEISWGGGPNNDDFHVFRIVNAPGTSTYSIWKDGILLTTAANMLDPYTGVFLNIGTISAACGEGQLDYIRWTTGAFEPVRTSDSTTWPCQQNCDSLSDPNFTANGTLSLAGGGIVNYGSGFFNSATWVALPPAWVGEGHSIEVRATITNEATYGFSVMAATTTQIYWGGFTKTDTFSQYKAGGGVDYWGGGTQNNYDDFHVFRFVHEANAPKFSIWRDGTLLTDQANVVPYTTPFLNLGHISGGAPAGQIDYVRWTPGPFPPPIAPALGTLVVVR